MAITKLVTANTTPFKQISVLFFLFGEITADQVRIVHNGHDTHGPLFSRDGLGVLAIQAKQGESSFFLDKSFRGAV